MQNARGLKSSCISVIISISIMILITGKTDDLQLVLAILMAWTGTPIPIQDPLFNLLFYYNTNHCKFANPPCSTLWCTALLCPNLPKKGENYHYPRKLSDGTPGSIMPSTTILGKKCHLPARAALRDARSKTASVSLTCHTLYRESSVSLLMLYLRLSLLDFCFLIF